MSLRLEENGNIVGVEFFTVSLVGFVDNFLLDSDVISRNLNLDALEDPISDILFLLAGLDTKEEKISFTRFIGLEANNRTLSLVFLVAEVILNESLNSLIDKFFLLFVFVLEINIDPEVLLAIIVLSVVTELREVELGLGLFEDSANLLSLFSRFSRLNFLFE